jgi:ligand-binding sensor domain-containing protein
VWHPVVAYLNLAIVGALVVGLSAKAQSPSTPPEDYLVDVWDTDSGLPHSTVTSIAQTPDGYLWVGTLHGGLARFDGVRFVNFYPGNTPELEDAEVQRLLVDAEGTLWIGFVKGEQFSYRQGQFRHERGDPRTPGAWLNELVASHPDRIVMSAYAGWLFRADRQTGTNRWQTLVPPDADLSSSFCEDRQGAIWYRTLDAGLAQFKDGRFQRVSDTPGLKSRQINVVTKDPAGRVWLGTEKELAAWDGKGFVTMTPTNGPAEIAVRQLAFCPDGGLWVRTESTLSKCAGQRWTAEAKPWDGRFSLSPRTLLMYGDVHGGVWLAHYGDGLWQVDAAGRAVHIGEKEGLPNGLVTCWFEDHEGNVWTGLSGGGLVRLRKRTFHLVWPAEILHDRAARSVCEDASGAMWFGTAGDTFLERREGRFTAFTPPPEVTAGRDGVVCPDAEGRLWAGTVQNGVWLFEGGQFKRPFPADAVGTVARALYADQGGCFWIGSEFGLYCWQTNALKHFSTNDGFGPGFVESLAEGAPGELWIGMHDGELRRLKDGRFTTHRLQESRDIRFFALWPETNGVVWIGSMGAGLLRFQDGKFTRYAVEAGLPNEHVSQLLGDRRGQLWLGTRGGIARVSKEALEQFARGEIKTVPFITYGKFDGLPSVECSEGCQPGCWRDRAGRLWFTTAKGAVWTRAPEIPFNPLPPPVHIEEVWVDGQRIKEAAWRAVGSPVPGPGLRHELQAGAGRHYFEFHFTALSFTAPDKVRFRWQMEGLEPEWVEGRDKRAVSYSFIPPGNYRFHVQGCNNDGVWNEDGDALALTVLPYYWQTWWFRLAVTGAAFVVLALVYSVRMARVRALERMRLRIARDLHDEVGANLGSIALLAQIMGKKPSAADAMQVRAIVKQTVDTLRDIVWFIEPKHDRISDLVARLGETARTMLQGVPYHFETSGDLGAQSLPLEFRRNVVPIFKEALHNVVKHAQATEVQIRAGRAGGCFELSIKDDGQGFAEHGKFPGNGLKNMRRRAAEIGGRLETLSQPGKGCTVRLSVPIPQTRDWKGLPGALV